MSQSHNAMPWNNDGTWHQSQHQRAEQQHQYHQPYHQHQNPYPQQYGTGAATGTRGATGPHQRGEDLASYPVQPASSTHHAAQSWQQNTHNSMLSTDNNQAQPFQGSTQQCRIEPAANSIHDPWDWDSNEQPRYDPTESQLSAQANGYQMASQSRSDVQNPNSHHPDRSYSAVPQQNPWPHQSPYNSIQASGQTYGDQNNARFPPPTHFSHQNQYSNTRYQQSTAVPTYLSYQTDYQDPRNVNKSEPAYTITRNKTGGSKLDKSFKMQHNTKEAFRFGAVFAILWAEPAGETSTLEKDGIFPGMFGESVHSKIRRMVVVNQTGDSASCVAITTYGGQGLSKPGINPSCHAPVSVKGTTDPTSREIDRRAGLEPVTVHISRPNEKLLPESLINFGKYYNVEYNVKTKPIGCISKESMKDFERNWKRIFKGPRDNRRHARDSENRKKRTYR